MSALGDQHAFPGPHAVQQRFQPTGQRMDDMISLGSPGMTFRQYAAIEAMKALVGNPVAANWEQMNDEICRELLVGRAIAYADILIRKLESK